MEVAIIVGVLAIIVVALLFLSFMGRKKKGMDKGVYWKRWEEVRNDLRNQNQKVVMQGVLAADKLVDDILRSKGLRGEKMSDRIKAAQRLLNYEDYNRLWSAHKLRNRIAHETNYRFSPSEMAAATRDYDKVIRALLG